VDRVTGRAAALTARLPASAALRARRLRRQMIHPVALNTTTASPSADIASCNGHPHNAAMCRLLSHKVIVSPAA
jgi:hypothetical protein